MIKAFDKKFVLTNREALPIRQRRIILNLDTLVEELNIEPNNIFWSTLKVNYELSLHQSCNILDITWEERFDGQNEKKRSE